MVDDLAILVACSAITSLHQGITGFVLSADIAVDAGPALITLAFATVSHLSVFTPSERSAYYHSKLGISMGTKLVRSGRIGEEHTWLQAIVAPKTLWTVAFAVIFVAASILSTRVSGK